MRKGFILTRQWRDTSTGVVIDLWLASDHGPLHLSIPSQKTVFFIRQSDQEPVSRLPAAQVACEITPLELKNFHGELLCGVYCNQHRQQRELVHQLAAVSIDYWEADIRPAERFLMERFITSDILVNIPDDAVKKQQWRMTDNTLKASSYQPQLKVASIDIETSMDARELYSIAVYSDRQSIVFMVGEADPSDGYSNDLPEMDIRWCATAKACLQQFMQWLKTDDPDILIGWHVVQFDCWVLYKLCQRWGVPFALGRGKQLPHWREDNSNSQTTTSAVADMANPVFDGKRRYLQVPGRVVLDGIELLRIAFYQFDSFSLQHVAQALLGEGKLLEHDNRGQAIAQLFEQDKRALARYNLQDCRLVWEIFDVTKLLDFAIERSRLTGLPMDKMGGSVASFEYAYLPRLHRRGYVAPNLGELQSDVVSPGGYVMRSIPGLYEHVLVLDFKSLYPSIIRTFNIDPYAFWAAVHESLDETAVIPGFNGAIFSRKNSILPDIIRDLWGEREKAKSHNNKPLSQAIKIIMNSFYGVLGSTGCRFFDPRVCSSITLRGHEIIQQSHEWIEQQGYQVIYGDTDSLFVWLGEGFSGQSEPDVAAQAIGQTLATSLNDWWRDRLMDKFDIDSALEIEFETHYSTFFMPTIRGSEQGSKKRYAGVINDGDKSELVFKGLETVRADWTPLAKRFQQELYAMVFAGEPYQAYIQDTVSKVLSGQQNESLVYRKRLRRPVAGYEKSNPPHVKAARHYESHSGEILSRGDRIQYLITVNGPEALQYRYSQIDYQHYIDKQLKPIADSILCFLDDSFERLIQKQMMLL